MTNVVLQSGNPNRFFFLCPKRRKNHLTGKHKKNTVRAGTDDIEIQLPQFESKIIYERFFSLEKTDELPRGETSRTYGTNMYFIVDEVWEYYTERKCTVDQRLCL